MTTYRAARRALSRKTRRAEIRRQARAAVAALAGELAEEHPGEEIEIVRTAGRRPRSCPCGADCLAEETRPGWLATLAPEQRWLHEQQSAWELALYFRPGAAEPLGPWRRAMAWIYARALRLAQAAARAAVRRPWEVWPLARAAELLLAHPHTGPPSLSGAREPWPARQPPRFALALLSGAAGMPP